MIREVVVRKGSWKRWGPDPRRALSAAAEHHGYSLADLSSLIRRDRTYLSRFVRLGVPLALAPEDHQRLADFFGLAPDGLGVRDLWERSA